MTKKWEGDPPRLVRIRTAAGDIRRVARWAVKPLGALHSELSYVSSAVDMYPRPSADLIQVALELGHRAQHAKVPRLAERAPSRSDAERVSLWPGEHYRLLNALATSASLLVEVGTFRGEGALALMEGGGEVVTFDVVRWDEVPGTWLRGEDFQGKGLVQHVADLSRQDMYSVYRDLLRRADVLFIDGPKDGRFERRFIQNLLRDKPHGKQLLVFDDIRLNAMLRFWRDLPLPKMDITSLGHVTGTGIAFRDVNVPPL